MNAMSQSLRRFQAVELVTSNPDYLLSVRCERVADLPTLACLYSITRPIDEEFWKELVVPENLVGWDAFASVLKQGNQNLFQSVYVVRSDKVSAFVDEAIDIFKARYLESGRQAVSTYERDHPTSQKPR